jgi:CSLREA domain-containing protein
MWLAAAITGLVVVEPAAARGTGSLAAGIIAVTTTADDFGGDPGQCSLREAIQALSTTLSFGGCPAGTPGDVIELPAGTYALTISGTEDDTNATGDLDLWVTMTVRTTAGRAIVDAGGLAVRDRVLDVHAGAVSLIDLTVTGGDVSAPALSSRVGGGLLNTTALTLTRVDVLGNAGGAGGGLFNAARLGTGLLLVDSQVMGNAAQYGAGVYNNQAALTVINSSIVSNSASQLAGGLYNDDNRGVVFLRNTTLSGNSVALGQGGGLFNVGALRLNNVTITANHAGSAGGVFSGGSLSLSNSVIGGNSADAGAADCSGELNSLGYNLIMDPNDCVLTGVLPTLMTGLNPGLGSLGLNGGRTVTHALLPESPARDRGNPAAPTGTGTACETVDQRGSERRGWCDLGAYDAADPWRVWMPSIQR